MAGPLGRLPDGPWALRCRLPVPWLWGVPLGELVLVLAV